jgi:hypothetical protein
MVGLVPARGLIVTVFLMAASPACAGFRPIGGVPAESFRGPKPAWRPLPVSIDFDLKTEKPRLRLPLQSSGRPLTARLDFKRLPGYGAWVGQRRAQGGTTWAALKAILDELGDGPAMVLCHEAVPSRGAATLRVGLRRGSRFQLYATIPGAFGPCGSRLCFEPGPPIFASHSAALAWSLLKPLALKEAKNAANR